MKSAIEKEKPPHGAIYDSDRGVQYVCGPYVKYLLENGFEPSMSRPATYEDNAFTESFFKTLKKEEVCFKKYNNLNDVLKSLPKFIEEVCKKKDFIHIWNTKAPKSSRPWY